MSRAVFSPALLFVGTILLNAGVQGTLSPKSQSNYTISAACHEAVSHLSFNCVSRLIFYSVHSFLQHSVLLCIIPITITSPFGTPSSKKFAQHAVSSHLPLLILRKSSEYLLITGATSLSRVAVIRGMPMTPTQLGALQSTLIGSIPLKLPQTVSAQEWAEVQPRFRCTAL